ncbi:MAG: transcription elongation factor GreA [Chlorobia bacterium]|nr:transcription elongation factor GreA [Fimbriimonadaceae bacterium]
MANQVLVTADGLAKLKAELEDLQGRRRMEIAEAIREAKAHGDLKENAAYHEAKLNQTRLEARISELERAVQTAKVIERSNNGGVDLGSKVNLLDLDFDDEFAVTLVGSFEADPAKELISITSPLGEALRGKMSGEEISVTSPNGLNRYRVVSVE